jgi:integrase
MTRTLHRDPHRRCLPLAEWPTPDRTAWLAALAPGDLLEAGGERARYAPASNRKTEKGYGRWLAWLLCRGYLEPEKAPADRITPERLRAYIADLSVFDASATILSRLQELHDAAAALDCNRNWDWIRQIARRVRAQHVPARAKRERMVHACDLLQVGEMLMAETSEQPTIRLQAMQFRDGLIIALLAARPLRLKNLTGLALGHSLLRRGDSWWIDIPPEETKTREPIEAPWPEVLNAPLATYLDVYRPLLCRLRSRWTRPVGTALWISTHGSPMTSIAIYHVLTRRTAEAYGKPINPHLFRDCAATSIAIEDPEHVRVASQILGHRSAATTERYYNQAQAIDAARRYQHFLVALRNGTITGDTETS